MLYVRVVQGTLFLKEGCYFLENGRRKQDAARESRHFAPVASGGRVTYLVLL